MKSASFFRDLTLPINIGDVTPNPGVEGVSIWSSITGSRLTWKGGAWEDLLAGISAGGGGTDYSGAIKKTAILNNKPSILLPFYMVPYVSGAWIPEVDLIINSAKKYKDLDFVVILNPSSGPGTVADNYYRRLVKKLKAGGCKVLGYVATGGGVDTSNAKYNSIVADINNWASFYPETDGIYFDEQSINTLDIPFYTSIVAYAKSVDFYPCVGNAGAECNKLFYGIMDFIVNYNASTYPDINFAIGDWEDSPSEKNGRQRACLVNSVYLDITQVDRLIEINAMLYIGDNSSSWNTLSSYFELFCYHAELAATNKIRLLSNVSFDKKASVSKGPILMWGTNTYILNSAVVNEMHNNHNLVYYLNVTPTATPNVLDAGIVNYIHSAKAADGKVLGIIYCWGTTQNILDSINLWARLYPDLDGITFTGITFDGTHTLDFFKTAVNLCKRLDMPITVMHNATMPAVDEVYDIWDHVITFDGSGGQPTTSYDLLANKHPFSKIGACYSYTTVSFNTTNHDPVLDWMIKNNRMIALGNGWPFSVNYESSVTDITETIKYINNIYGFNSATSIKNIDGVVNVSGPAPAIGDVLTATSPTTAEWSAPAASGGGSTISFSNIFAISSLRM